MKDYAGTPAGAKAEQFYQTVRPHLELERLERRSRAPVDPDLRGLPQTDFGREIRRLRDRLDEEQPIG